MQPFIISLLRRVYPIQVSNLRRDRPPEVLALGLSRLATESVCNAQFDLGYSDVHYGCRFILSRNEAVQWLRLAHAQHTRQTKHLTALDFGKVLGDCAAVTDQPSCGFTHDLITAYPDAKVMFN